jgi:hypothetical protein
MESVLGLLTRRGVTAASVDELVRATQSVRVHQSRN